MSDWRDVAAGPVAVAERDQFEAELFDKIRGARILFVATAQGEGETLDVSVRGLCNLPELGDAGYRDAYAQFLLMAMEELSRMVDELADGVA
jgi:hypothetical protein